MDSYIYLSDYDKVNNKLGSKAVNLIKLAYHNFNIPNAFILTPEFQKQFFLHNNLDKLIEKEIKNLKSSNYSKVSESINIIRKSIVEATFTEEEIKLINSLVSKLITNSEMTFAIRSSCSFEDGNKNSWAGQFDSFLNIDKKEVHEYIKRCWASIFSLRTLKYNKKILLNEIIPPFSILVQEMIIGDCSGIAFSVDPITGDKNKVLIEAVAKTAEKAVSGEEIPYTVTISKKDNIIVKRTFGRLGRKELLKPSDIENIMEYIKRIEKLLDSPVDIEWTIKDSKLYLLQSRPITKINKIKKTKEKILPNILNYQLVFKVRGLNFIFADLLHYGFGYLHPLFICDGNEFFQYFTNERMEYAAKYGYNWLKKEDGFNNYKRKFTTFHKKSQNKINRILEEELTLKNTEDFFNILFNYFIYYSKMDFQFTNLVYLYSTEDKIIENNLKELANFKDIARNWINEASINDNCQLAKMLDLISKQFNINKNKLQYYKITDIYNLFENKYVEKEIIKDRIYSAVVIHNHNKTEYIIGKEAKEFVSSIRELRKLQRTSTLTGQVASRKEERFVSGKVKIIHTDYEETKIMEKEIAEMSEGSILIAKFTAPELIGACKKAKAVVTDQGGMLSHAAIISRELGIPCIVGTEYATHSLNDGEEIKMDLDLGTIEKM